MRGVGFHAAVLGLTAAASLAHAQALDPGVIAPDGSTGDGSALTWDGTSHTYTIDDDHHGDYSNNGKSLFHSFGRFDIPAGHTAQFVATAGAPERVFARVTGKDASVIGGTLRSHILGPESVPADFYLINPYGVTFEGGANVDVNGSFHVTSADRINFGNEAAFTAFAADPPPLFTVASPSSYGFLPEPSPGGSIEFRPLDAPLSVEPEKTFAAVGGDVRIGGSNFTTFESPGSRVVLVAAGPGTEVPFELENFDPASLPAETPLGAVDLLLRSTIRVSLLGTASGSVVVRAGSFSLTNGSRIFSVHGESADSAYPHAVDIAVRDALHIDGGALIQVGTQADRNDLEPDSHGRGGDLVLRSGGSIEITNAELLAFSRLSGDPSHIRVEANSVALSEDGRLVTRAEGSRPGGSIDVDVENLSLTSGGRIVSESRNTGAGGPVLVAASRVEATDEGGTSGVGTAIESSTDGSLTDGDLAGAAGSISIAAERLALGDGAQIRSTTSSSGNAGHVVVKANEIDVEGTSRDPGGNVRNASIETRALAGSSGDAGERQPDDSILGVSIIEAQQLRVADGGRLGTSTLGSGDAGSLRLDAGEWIRLEGGPVGGAEVVSQARPGSTGDGGTIRIETRELSVRDGSQITASTISTGDAGDIEVVAEHVDIRSGQIGGNRSGLFAQTLADGNPLGGDAGSVHIAAGEIVLGEQSVILVQTTNGGVAGSVRIDGGRLLLDGGSISAEATQDATGAAGSIEVTVGDVQVQDAGRITASTRGRADAGTVRIVADHLEIRGASGASPETQSGIFAETTFDPALSGAGSAGGVDIESSGDVALRDGARIAVQTWNEGLAGNIEVDAQGRVVLDGATTSVSAKATETSSADGGSVHVTADKGVFLNGGAVVEARALGTGAAGEVVIDAGPRFEMAQGSKVSTESASSGGGVIRISAGERILLTSSGINTNVAFGGGTGGDVHIDPDLMVLNHSVISARAADGNGGRIFIRAGTFVMSEDSNMDVGCSGQNCIDGIIVLSSPAAEISSERAEPAAEYVDASQLLRTSCGVAGGEQTASFVVSRIAGLPASPEGPLPAPLWDALAQSDPPSAGAAPASISVAYEPHPTRVRGPAGGCQSREEL